MSLLAFSPILALVALLSTEVAAECASSLCGLLQVDVRSGEHWHWPTGFPVRHLHCPEPFNSVLCNVESAVRGAGAQSSNVCW